MRTKSVPLALLLAATALSVQAQTADPAAERTPAPATLSAIDHGTLAVERPARQTRADKAAPAVGAESAFSVFTYDALGATPRVQFGRRHTAPDATDAKPVAAR